VLRAAWLAGVDDRAAPPASAHWRCCQQSYAFEGGDLHPESTPPASIGARSAGRPRRRSHLPAEALAEVANCAYFRFYAPTEPYFDRSWSLPDIERVK